MFAMLLVMSNEGSVIHLSALSGLGFVVILALCVVDGVEGLILNVVARLSDSPE